MKRYAYGILWLALLAQVGWVIVNTLVLRQSPGLDIYGVIIVAFFTLFAALRGRLRWMATIARFLMSFEFLASTGDRFGLLGGPGTPGVSWGDFGHFVTYTRSVNAFLPASIAPTLAVLATIAEIGLSLALLLGVRPRLAALGAAGLLFTYGAAMSVSLPPAEQFHYNVFVLGAGMLALASVDATAFGVEALLARLRRRGRGRPELAPPSGSRA